MSEIYEATGVFPNDQCLFYGDNQLDGRSAYDFIDGSLLRLSVAASDDDSVEMDSLLLRGNGRIYSLHISLYSNLCVFFSSPLVSLVLSSIHS